MILIIFIIIFNNRNKKTIENENQINNIQTEAKIEVFSVPEEIIEKIKIDDWKILLVNKDNPIPDNFEVKLGNIDKDRKFDIRALPELQNMISTMQKEGIINVWVQSAYRSEGEQQDVYSNSIKKYISQGKTKEEAQKLTSEYINKSGTSEHNLGLAIDFNFINQSFENSKAFKWLIENAEDYGFILRYKKEKESITGVRYEPWHWRYVGVEHAKLMNEMDFCLEEYIKYLDV